MTYPLGNNKNTLILAGQKENNWRMSQIVKEHILKEQGKIQRNQVY